MKKAYFNGKRGKELVDVIDAPIERAGIRGLSVNIRRQMGDEMTVHVEQLEEIEDFPTYLRRVASDYRESGNEATAEDYEQAADRIDAAVYALNLCSQVPACAKGAKEAADAATLPVYHNDL